MSVHAIEELISRASRAGLGVVLDGCALVIESQESNESLAAQIFARAPEAVRALCDPPPTFEGLCIDCAYRDTLIAGYCFECGERRRFLANDLPCGCVGRRWRYRDGGFYWHCEQHEEAPAHCVWSRSVEVPARVLQFENARLAL